MKPNLVRPYPPSLDTRRNIFKVARFRVLYGRIDTEPERVDSIVKACTVLHNFLCHENVSSDEYVPADDGRSQSQSGGLVELQRVGRQGSQEAKRVREAYADYFVSSEGSVPWQSDHVARTL